jgi:hypothetical protein
MKVNNNGEAREAALSLEFEKASYGREFFFESAQEEQGSGKDSQNGPGRM